MNNCEEFELSVQALADSELVLIDTDKQMLFEHLSNCKSCRELYTSTVKLNQSIKMSGGSTPSDKWLDELNKKKSRTIWQRAGIILIIIPYILILTIGIQELFADNSESFLLKVCIGGISFGFIVLLVRTIIDRIKESKNDKYREVIR
ncbi:MAG: hypothetical protein OCD02_08635 [Spirochaetaceae bacterium]